MKLSELSTDQALDALCEMTPYINSITKDKEILDVFSEKMDTKDMTILSVKIISASRYNEMLSIILKKHRADVYGILAIINQKAPEEIAAQTVMDTMNQFRDVFQDKEFLDFFKSFMPQGRKEPSAPSAASPASE